MKKLMMMAVLIGFFMSPIQSMEAPKRVLVVLLKVSEDQVLPSFAERVKPVVHNSVAFNARMFVAGDISYVSKISSIANVNDIPSMCEVCGIDIYDPKGFSQRLQRISDVNLQTKNILKQGDW